MPKVKLEDAYAELNEEETIAEEVEWYCDDAEREAEEYDGRVQRSLSSLPKFTLSELIARRKAA